MRYIAALVFSLGILASLRLHAEDAADGTPWAVTGHVKYQTTISRFPRNSAFRDVLGSNEVGQSLTTRLNLAWTLGHWSMAADYQLGAFHFDTTYPSASTLGHADPQLGVFSDARRWWNLTNSTSYGDRSVIVNRLDRLYVSYGSERLVWRFGRQAISWGNGLVFTPMDVFNPFDPAAVDREYKTGDDMLYGQWLFDNGNDLQGIGIVRRNPVTGKTESDQSSLALKYHGFLNANEFDILLARHYGHALLGAGGIVSLGGAIWRGDVTWSKTGTNTLFSAVSSLNYSWLWGGRNVIGLVEYYFSGFGQRDRAYATDQLQQNSDLFARLERGELFTLGRHYLATSLTVELSPLLRLTPNIFLNLQDPSALAQLVAQYDWKQDLVLLAALNIPVGPDGSEYGGPKSVVIGKYLSASASLLVQLAFYF